MTYEQAHLQLRSCATTLAAAANDPDIAAAAMVRVCADARATIHEVQVWAEQLLLEQARGG